MFAQHLGLLKLLSPLPPGRLVHARLLLSLPVRFFLLPRALAPLVLGHARGRDLGAS